MSKVDIDYNVKDHACTGHVMSCSDTGRTIASFWSESDINSVAEAINNHDRLVQELGQSKSNLNELISFVSDIQLGAEHSYDLDALINKIQGGE